MADLPTTPEQISKVVAADSAAKTAAGIATQITILVSTPLFDRVMRPMNPIVTLKPGEIVNSLGSTETSAQKLAHSRYIYINYKGTFGYVPASTTNGKTPVDYSIAYEQSVAPIASISINTSLTLTERLAKEEATLKILTAIPASTAEITNQLQKITELKSAITIINSTASKVIPVSTAFSSSTNYKIVNVPAVTALNVQEKNVKGSDKTGGNPPSGFTQLDIYGNDGEPPSNRFRMIIYTTAAPNGVIFTLTIGPTGYSQTFGNNISPIKTGSGFVLMRSGPAISEMQLQGVMLDTQETDERRTFLDDFYSLYLKDQVNAFHEYFTEARLVFELAGYRYTGLLASLTLSKNATSLFLYSYTMSLLITSATQLKSGK